uniref:DUF1275 domain-containing protein n=1 Tax=Attheya septentrionalis TaxID=420275 RepID=A0A7S2UH02_9STRA|mmetsp:Transcript_25085/g.45409  ORF Transcript_25085/g.45409 Transcript_25085/m.45409 type:complete len:335 (+) Transcript_25085:245-1249(+)
MFFRTSFLLLIGGFVGIFITTTAHPTAPNNVAPHYHDQPPSPSRSTTGRALLSLQKKKNRPQFLPRDVQRGGALTSLSHRNNEARLTQKKSLPPKARQIFILSLSALAAIADVLCYYRFEAFAAMMTGNTINLSISIGERRYRDAAWRGSLIFSYSMGLIFFRYLDVRCRDRWTYQGKGRGSASTASAIAPIILTLFGLHDLLALGKGPDFRNHVPLIAVGFGILNAASTEIGLAPSCFMTGHITKVATGLADSFLRPAKKRRGMRLSIKVLTIFVGTIITSVLIKENINLFEMLVVVPDKVQFWLRRFPFTTLGICYALLFGIISFCFDDVEA